MIDGSKTYIGTKQVKAYPITRQAYNDLRGWSLPADEDGADAGYLVEYLDGGKPNHPGFDGYISWSPAEQFEAAYRPVTGMTFGLALEAIKKGFRVAREGWNGKGMFIFLVPGSNLKAGVLRPNTPYKSMADEMGMGADDAFIISGHIDMKAADGSMVVGWLASQTDMLAEDWKIVS
jgi:hypothetical protein